MKGGLLWGSFCNSWPTSGNQDCLADGTDDGGGGSCKSRGVSGQPMGLKMAGPEDGDFKLRKFPIGFIYVA